MNYIKNAKGNLENASKELVSAIGQLDEAGKIESRKKVESLEEKVRELKQDL